MQARIQGCQRRIKIILVKSALIEALEANAIIRNLMIGSWIVPPDASDRIAMGSISNYREDGILENKIFKTHKCKNQLMVLVAYWIIENGKLSIKNTRS